jgi:AI-2 transport protein TqsA
VVFGAAIQFESQIPIYQTRLMEFIDVLTHYIPSQEELSANSILCGIASTMISLMSNIIQGLLNAGTTAEIIILTTAFLLIDAVNTPEKINSELEKQSKLQMRMSKFDKNLVGFLIIRTETNLITAVGIVIFFLLGGIDFAILWGVLIFLLSYIPFIGLFLVSIPPAMLALFKYGTAGALLFIPLTVILKIVLESFDETKWLARFMGPTADIDNDEKMESQEKIIC